LAVQRDVFGIVGFLGPNARITSAAVLGTEVPLVNFAPTLPTIDEIINPWIFRCRGDEPRRLRLVLDYIIDQLGCTRIAVVRTPDSTGDSHLEWYADQARLRGYPVVADVSYEPGVGDLDSGLRKVRESGAQAVLTWCDLNRSVQILKHMREIGMPQLFLGGEEIANRAFIESAGDRAGRVIAAWPQVDRAHPNAVAEFTQAYVARFKRQPSPYAFGIYEATNHLLSAIDSAGADRWAVRQALGRMSGDAVGEMHSERFSPRRRDVILGALTGGLWQLETASDLDVEPSDGVP
jgi:branched-chain amino acid transport system substrate-binding protein